MITLKETRKKADDFLKPIYAATVLGQIKWEDTLDGFCTKETFNGFSFQINNDNDFLIYKKNNVVLSFNCGEIGEKLIEYLTLKREKQYLNVFKEALNSLTEYIEKKGNEMEH